VATGTDLTDELAILEKQCNLVRANGQLRLVRDGGIGVLVNNQSLGCIGTGNRKLTHTTFYKVNQTHRFLLE
jgi:hypothetical protein